MQESQVAVAARDTLTPVLLLGGGAGEATCGILYLAGFLRRNGIEAFVRLYDGDETEADIRRTVSKLLAHVKPKLVGVSLKWFNHVSRALLIAKLVREIDPDVKIVLGGDSASYYWRELSAHRFVDEIILGDGEVPLLSLCQGERAGPNLVTRSADGSPRRLPLQYVQNGSNNEVFYSHFDEMFLSQLDQYSFSGWVAPGKGCGENCVYCAGGRGLQQASFGRPDSFLRPAESVQRDHLEIAPRTWQLRYDFSGGTAEFLGQAWREVDLSKHSTTYFLWGVPPRSLLASLSKTFGRVYLVLDIGCFSALQRTELMRRGLLKPCPTDRELLATVEACRAYPNLKLEVCGIGGLPFTSAKARAQEGALVEQLLGMGCDVGSQRLEAQPGALVTQHPDRFEMVTDARSFEEFVDWFAQRGHASGGAFPMIRYADPKVEAEVQRAADELQAKVERQALKKAKPISGRTKLVTAIASTLEVQLGDWLGRHLVPKRFADEPVTVMRSVDGAGLACAPRLSERRFSDPNVQQGATAEVILTAIRAFAKPVTIDATIARLGVEAGLDPDSAREVIDQLAAGRFLQEG